MSLETESGQELERTGARVRELEQRVAELGERLLAADARLSRIAVLEVQLREAALAGVELDEALKRIAALEGELGQLPRISAERDEAQELLSRARATHDAMIASPSWRLTAPLRRLKSGLRRGR